MNPYNIIDNITKAINKGDFILLTKLLKDFRLMTAAVRAQYDQSAPDQVACEQVLPDQVACEQVLPEQVACEQVLPDQVACEQVLPDQAACERVACEREEFRQGIVRTCNTIFNNSIRRIPITSDTLECIKLFYRMICTVEIDLYLRNKVLLLFGIKSIIMKYCKDMIREIDYLIISSIVNFASTLGNDLSAASDDDILNLENALQILSIKTMNREICCSSQETKNKQLMISAIEDIISTNPAEAVSLGDRILILQLQRNLRLIPCMHLEIQVPRLLFPLVSACRSKQTNRLCMFNIMLYWSFFPNHVVLIHFIDRILFRL
jgi:hypothetical protein